MADIDDSPDKARRNLLLLSGAVIAYSYLRPTFPLDAKLFGVISWRTIDMPRFLVIVMILLTYFFIRFFRSPSWRIAFAEWRLLRAARWTDVVAKHFDPYVLKYLKGEEPDSAVTGLFVLDRSPQGAFSGESLDTLKLHRKLEWRSDHHSHGILTVQADYLTFMRAERRSYNFEVIIIPERFRWKHRWNTVWSQVTSNLALEVHLPIGMATIAAICIGISFARTCNGHLLMCAF